MTHNTQDIIDKITSFGFKVNDRGIITKYSQSDRRWTTAGQLNEAGAYFYAQNVSPFQQGTNTAKDILGDELKQYVYVAPIKVVKDVEYNFTFQEYETLTRKKNQLGEYIKKFIKKHLGQHKKFENLYDLRGVKTGYMSEATLFPYINRHNEFQSAKIVKYSKDTGKRSKDKYSMNTFHSYSNIKEALGIEGKVTKSYNCFFGEHLVPHNNKPVVIVESEKTAIILSNFFKNIVFIATGGLTQLESLDYSFLYCRDVTLFPDNGAYDLWNEIGEHRGWRVSRVLEQEGVIKSSDALDYFETYDTDPDKKNIIWWQLQKELSEINYLEAPEVDYKHFSFKKKKRTSEDYYTPRFELFDNVVSVYSTQKGSRFRGNDFLIYDEEFKHISARIDFNALVRTEEGLKEVTVDDMLYRIEKLYKVIRFLNPEKNYNKIVYKLLKDIRQFGNYEFNAKFIKKDLFPYWDSNNNDINNLPAIVYVKPRNWIFSSSRTFKQDSSDFLEALNNDKKLHSTNRALIDVLPLVKEREFIQVSQLFRQERDNKFVWNLIKEYNEKFVGAVTEKSYLSQLEVKDFIEAWGDKKPSRRVAIDNGVSDRAFRDHNKDLGSDKALNKLVDKIERYITNPLSFEIEREVTYSKQKKEDRKGNGKKITLVLKPTKFIYLNIIELMDKHKTSPKKAFEGELDLSGSYFDVTKEDALSRFASYGLDSVKRQDWLKEYINFKYRPTPYEMVMIHGLGLEEYIRSNGTLELVEQKIDFDFIDKAS